MITALLLDVDDTLIDTRSAMVAAGQAAVAALWPDVAAPVHHAAAVRFHGDPRGFFDAFTRGEMSFAQMRQARVADLLEFFSLAPVDEVNSRFEDVYEPAFSANVRVFEDVWPLTDAAGKAGVAMGLLTNSSSSYTRHKLEISGLEDVFTVVATRDTLGFGKPDPRAFHHACALLGSVPAKTMYVGDHVEIDAIAARDAGLAAVLLQRDDADPQGAVQAGAHGIAVVRSLREVPALLAAH